jgi:adenosylhomocysteine nucleosidase
MIIGIMGAMPEEVDVLREQMTDVSAIERGGRKYYRGQFNQTEVILVFSRWGKVAAAITATTLITEFKIDQLVFMGVAAAINPDLRVGDVVIGDQYYQHDMDARPVFPKHRIPLTDVTFFKADPYLVQRAEFACQAFLKSIVNSIPIDSLKEFGIHRPQCKVGVIASGDQFIGSAEKVAAILADQPHTDAVEMEGAAVAQACHDYRIPFVVIRIISDLADHSAHIDFPPFIQKIVKHYSANIMNTYTELTSKDRNSSSTKGSSSS